MPHAGAALSAGLYSSRHSGHIRGGCLATGGLSAGEQSKPVPNKTSSEMHTGRSALRRQICHLYCEAENWSARWYNAAHDIHDGYLRTAESAARGRFSVAWVFRKHVRAAEFSVRRKNESFAFRLRRIEAARVGGRARPARGTDSRSAEGVGCVVFQGPACEQGQVSVEPFAFTGLQPPFALRSSAGELAWTGYLPRANDPNNKCKSKATRSHTAMKIDWVAAVLEAITGDVTKNAGQRPALLTKP